MDSVLGDYMEEHVRPTIKERFRRIMEASERCACGKCDDFPPARLVLASELDHNSELARYLKSKEVSERRKKPSHMSEATLREFRQHLSIMQPSCHQAKTIADQKEDCKRYSSLFEIIKELTHWMVIQHIQRYHESKCRFSRLEITEENSLVHRHAHTT